MPERERRPLPQWAERERVGDLAWIGENLYEFWAVAWSGYEQSGRGVLVVDTTVSAAGGRHPFGYISQEQIRQLDAQGTIPMMEEYDPSWEMVIVLLKPRDRTSSYRVGVPGHRPNPTAR